MVTLYRCDAIVRAQLEPEERRNREVTGDDAKWFLGRLRAGVEQNRA
jgi:hypothetical protein